MRRITLRVGDDLADRLKAVARDRKQSLNVFAQAVLSAAVDPELGTTGAERLRERLARAGLLAAPSEPARATPTDAERERAGAAAGGGRPLADLVSEDRR